MIPIERIVVVDTETGGLDPKEHSLLSIGLVILDVYNTTVEVGNTLEVILKHDTYKVTGEALNVNKINILEHHNKAVSPDEALNQIVKFLVDNGFNQDNKATLAGHNVKFDIGFLRKLFNEKQFFIEDGLPELPEDSEWVDLFDRLFGHRTIDTSPIAKFLYHVGSHLSDNSSSSKLFERYPLATELPTHTALGDALRTAYAYKAMIEEMRRR